eukprot:scaffold219_cov119-Skeletonema_dohrnii-CCMP3373.AAC.5
MSTYSPDSKRLSASQVNLALAPSPSYRRLTMVSFRSTTKSTKNAEAKKQLQLQSTFDEDDQNNNKMTGHTSSTDNAGTPSNIVVEVDNYGTAAAEYDTIFDKIINMWGEEISCDFGMQSAREQALEVEAAAEAEAAAKAELEQLKQEQKRTSNRKKRKKRKQAADEAKEVEVEVAYVGEAKQARDLDVEAADAKVKQRLHKPKRHRKDQLSRQLQPVVKAKKAKMLAKKEAKQAKRAEKEAKRQAKEEELARQKYAKAQAAAAKKVAMEEERKAAEQRRLLQQMEEEESQLSRQRLKAASTDGDLAVAGRLKDFETVVSVSEDDDCSTVYTVDDDEESRAGITQVLSDMLEEASILLGN